MHLITNNALKNILNDKKCYSKICQVLIKFGSKDVTNKKAFIECYILERVLCMNTIGKVSAPEGWIDTLQKCR